MIRMKIGQINRLAVTKVMDFGLLLFAGDYGSVLLAKNEAPQQAQVGDELAVFLYFDTDQQLVATTQKPIAQVGEWGLMKIVGINQVGAFVDWGIKEKDLLIPFSEQRRRFNAGETILVYVYSDKASGRIVGTTKFNKWLDKTPAHYEPNQAVELLIAEKSELGFKAIINGEHWGMIFSSDVFGRLYVGKKLTGYIKHIREDGKIDLALQKIGREKRLDLGEHILQRLAEQNGFLALSDKSSPEAIFAAFGTSKGTFKKTIGSLYKQGVIAIEENGIRLTPQKTGSRRPSKKSH